jgi:hypothetical protein
MRPTTTARTVTILPPSARAETWMVARAVFHIVYWSALTVSAQTYLPGAKAAASAPSPFERRFQDLDARDQRLFRALREGVAEAERRRSATGLWPSADALASAGVPPFAPDPIDRTRHAWTFAKAGTTVNYLGTPTSGETFLVLVVEPDPGTPVDPQALVDDVHHRLDDGTMIHVTVWMGPGLGTSREVVTVPPPEQGWKQITVGAGG